MNIIRFIPAFAILATAFGQAPVITAQPQPRSVAAGAAVTFNVAATGAATLSYQWRKNGTDISGATNATLALTNVQPADAGSYTVAVANTAGSATSNAATLAIVPPVVSLVLKNDPALVSPNYLVSDGSYYLLVSAVGVGNTQSIYRVFYNGGLATKLYPAFNPLGIAVAGANVFWIDPNSGSVTDTQILSAPKSGGGSVSAIYSGASVGQPILDGSGLTSDGTILYAADEVNGSVWRVNADGTALTQIGPNRYSGGFTNEHLNTIAFSRGNLYVADSGKSGVVSPSVLSIATNGTAFTTLASGSPFVRPTGIAVGDDMIFVADAGANTIWQMPIGGGTPTALVTSGTPVTFNSLGGLTYLNGELYVADTGAGAIYRVSTITPASQPYVVSPPRSKTAVVGANVTFSFAVSGAEPLSYQWKKDGTNVAGATSSVLTLTNVQLSAAGSYSLQVSNSVSTTTSVALPLTVASAAPTNDNFASATALTGATTQATGSNIGASLESGEPDHSGHTEVNFVHGGASVWWQWTAPATGAAQVDTIGSNFDTQLAVYSGTSLGALTLIGADDEGGGSHTSKLTFFTTAGTVYRFAVDGYLGASGTITLTVAPATGAAPSITSQPYGYNTQPGTMASLYAAATGTFPLTFQWRKNGTPISGATDAYLRINNVQTADAGDYTLVVTNALGSATSNAATLTVGAPTITTFPYSQTVTVGANATFTVVASGTGTLTYQWQKNGTAITGATNATLTLSNVQAADAGSYTVVVSNSGGSTTSYPVSLTVSGGAPAITVQPQSQLVAAGGSVTFSVTATGTGPLSYQWNKNGTAISGATNSSYTIASAQAADAGSYTVVVSNSAGSATSNAATLTIGTAPANDNFVNAITLTGATVQVTGTNVNASKETGEPNHGGSTGGKSVWWSWTAPAAGTVTIDTIGSSFDTVLGVYTGTSVSALTLIAGDDDSGGSLTSRVTFAATSGTVYRIAVDGFGAATGSIMLQVTAAGTVSVPGITSPTSATATVGVAFSYTITASNSPTAFAATGLPAGLSLNTTSGVISGTPTTAGTNTVSMTASNSVGTSPAVTLNLVVNVAASAPAITTQPQSQTVAAGASVTFTVVATGTPAPTYQWKKNGLNLSGATSATLSIASVQSADAGSYTVVATNSAGSVTSSAATLTVGAPPTPPAITTQPLAQTVTVGANVSLTVAASGTAPLAYQWKKNGTDITDATSATLALSNVQSGDSGSYAVVVSNSAGSVTSTPATLTVSTPGSGIGASLAVVGAPVYTPAGGNVSLAATFTYTGLTPTALGYTINVPTGWALVSTGGTNVPGVVPPAGTTGALEYAYTSFPVDQASFTVVVSYPSGLTGNQTISASATYRTPLQNLTVPSLVLTRVEPPTITTQPANKVAVVGASVTFTVAATSSASLSYQWKKAGADISGATSSTLTLTNVQVADAASYTVVVSNSAGSVTSTAATLAVIDARATHAVSGGGYFAGGTVTITNTLTYAGTAAGLGWQVLLPAGWSYASGAGSEGDVKPPAGTTDLLEWAWTTIPASPLTFTYTLNVPAGTTGDKSLAALVLFRQSGNLVQFLATPDPLVVTRVTTHSADTDRNFRLSLLELTRVIELYNTRSGTTRTGCYKVEASGEDGFSPEPARAASATVTLAQYHSADSSRDGKLSLLELTRVIELYNYRSGTTRTGQYRAQVGTEDNFAPGP